MSISSSISISLDAVRNAIEDLFLEIATESTFDAILESIQRMFQVAVNHENRQQKIVYFLQGIISIKSSQLYSGYLRTSVKMDFNPDDQGNRPITQIIGVETFNGLLNFAKCQRNSSTILGWDATDINEWENNTSSAPLPPN